MTSVLVDRMSISNGLSLSCQPSIVRNNLVNNNLNPTDASGGIVVLGSPGRARLVDTIWNHGVVTIPGPSSRTTLPLGALPPTRGLRSAQPLGPRLGSTTSFGPNGSHSGTFLNNNITGAFGYGIAITSARNFTMQGNALFDNTSFIGSGDQIDPLPTRRHQVPP
ncbi:hypothetical protein BGW80DRAFT_615684 [Lactifluus volemus]|nr:hypothetical protein BGW80DRAFT_615684 [Lactifluus volemus]